MGLSLPAIERRFRALRASVLRTVSARHRMFLIDHFLGEINADFRKYRSYIIELSAELPAFNHPLSYTGMNPGDVAQAACRIDELLLTVPELHEYPGFEAYALRLNQMLVMLFWFTGDIDNVVKYLHKQPIPGDTDYHRNLLKRQGFAELLRVIHQHKDCRAEGHRFLKGLEADLQKIYEPEESSVLIPVAETHVAEGSSVVYGRLRRLYSTVRRSTGKADKASKRISGKQGIAVDSTTQGNASGSEAAYESASVVKDQFRRLFNIAGVEETHWPPDDVVLQAYRNTLVRHAPELSEVRFSGELSYELNIPLHEGRSSNAAVAALLLQGAQQAGGARRQFSLEPSVCITGEIDAEGQVLPVSADTIRQKAEAFFFSWSDALVVPMAQEPLFRSVLQGFAMEYPNRRYVLLGLTRIDDLYFDRRLTRLRELNPATQLLKKAWKRKFETVGTSVIILLLLIIASLVYGPLDQNPVRGEISGDYLELYNKYNQKLSRFHLGDDFGFHMTLNQMANSFFHLIDINGDGINELIYFKQDGVIKDVVPELVAWSVRGDSLIWSNELRHNLEFSNRFGQFGKLYYGNHLTSTFDVTGDLVILASINEYRYFPSLLQKINPQSGEIVSYYYHPGHIRSLSLMDIDGDGIAEVLIGGVNNAKNAAFMAILDIDSIAGHSPLTDLYYLEGKDPANERVYLVMPPTSMFEFGTTFAPYNSLALVLPSGIDSTIKVTLMDTILLEESNFIYGLLDIEMDLNLNVLGVYTHDVWDRIIHGYYRNGLIDALPDADYFREYVQTFRRIS